MFKSPNFDASGALAIVAGLVAAAPAYLAEPGVSAGLLVLALLILLRQFLDFSFLETTEPLHVAAQKAYAKARAEGSLWAEAAERLGVDNSERDILEYMATSLLQDVPVTGVRRPSTKREAVPLEAARKAAVGDGAQLLILSDAQITEFRDLRVNKLARRRRVAHMLQEMRELKPLV